ncbi:quinoprotein dehydrogenase-associated SoxYZ-like carrier [Variovorax sp. J22R133]|uniref:quinoprotein dehydrogenase-associated SoxYZ-like carrier n=1 Tax=Variovorax brevis TaxID=3053503 RepID=UPI0025757286|nr:quinoprotein dehydrogenase-associated SoxYZ-like carrier [Variovorax sp. J22R133]MDM0111831.1 quinoprotein dehydrogenase-associated SoxYZ-like carrier [Variovorax sp. J22R133]
MSTRPVIPSPESPASRRAFALGALLVAALFAHPALAQIKTADNPDANPVWQKVRASLFQSRPIANASDDVISIVAPVRAEDAAIVPIAIKTRMPQTPTRYIDKVYLIIDNNPSPISAVFNFTPQSGRADIETRVRVDEYTHVRAIAETNDGKLHMATAFVKASGGCSAPPGKDAEAAAKTLGRMKLSLEGHADANQPQLAQLMISHPNSSGLALDQVSRLYTPPHFVRQVNVTYAGQPVMSADVDFSISENPNFRFYFQPRGDGELKAEIVDSHDLRFESALKYRRPE